MNRNGAQTGITEDIFIRVSGCGIAIECCLNIKTQKTANRRQRREKLINDLNRPGIALDTLSAKICC